MEEYETCSRCSKSLTGAQPITVAVHGWFMPSEDTQSVGRPRPHAFMRLCVHGGGLFSVTSCRVVPPLVRGAARLTLASAYLASGLWRAQSPSYNVNAKKPKQEGTKTHVTCCSNISVNMYTMIRRIICAGESSVQYIHVYTYICIHVHIANTTQSQYMHVSRLSAPSETTSVQRANQVGVIVAGYTCSTTHFYYWSKRKKTI